MAKKKTEKLPVIALKWANIPACTQVEPVAHKDMVLQPGFIACNGKTVIVSEPYQDSDGKVKYLLFDRDTGKWDKRHPKIALAHKSPKTTVVALGGCV